MTVAEVVLLTIPGSGNLGPVNIDNPTQIPFYPSLIIRGTANVTIAGTSTGFSLRCRRLGLTGTQVGTTQATTIVAGDVTAINVPFTFQDLANPDPSGGYVITGAAVVATNTVNEIIGSINDGS
jgi:hypothetical protein